MFIQLHKYFMELKGDRSFQEIRLKENFEGIVDNLY